MPIIVPKDLPAFKVLKDENIFVMPEKRAFNQDIRPIEIAIVNLMPTKIETEIQLLRLLGNSPLQVNITLINMKSHTSKNTEPSHLEKFYKTFEEVKNFNFDGMIFTGAPVEKLEYSDITYYKELTEIFDYASKKVTSSIFICWAAQAALKYYYDIDKTDLNEKMFGIYPYKAQVKYELLLKGMDDEFYMPMSRYTHIDEEQVYKNKNLKVLASSDRKGIGIIKSKDNKRFFLLGHVEYGRNTLKKEYERDIEKNIKINPPENYFNSDGKTVNMTWASTGNLIYYNWLNYYLYQITPYDISKVGEN